MFQFFFIMEKDKGLVLKLVLFGLVVFCQFVCLFDIYVEVKMVELVDGG